MASARFLLGYRFRANPLIARVLSTTATVTHVQLRFGRNGLHANYEDDYEILESFMHTAINIVKENSRVARMRCVQGQELRKIVDIRR
jgi:hypothetical protein